VALNVTLAKLIEGVQHETSMSATPNVGQNFRANLAYKLAAEQEYLYQDFQWPHMKGTLTNGWFDKVTVAGQRYYNYPTDMDAQHLPALYRKHGDTFAPVPRGIAVEDYNAFNSDDEVGSDPVLKWSPHTAAQFEVWPIPQTDGLTLRFTGRRALRALLAESDPCDLDSQLLILRVAAQVLERRDTKAAASVQKRADRLYRVLKSNQMTNTKFSLAAGGEKAGVEPNERIISATRVETS